MDSYEESFQQITGIVLGTKLIGMDDYGPWLVRGIQATEEVKSVYSGKMVYMPPFDFYRVIKNRLVQFKEAFDVIGKKQLSKDELDKLTIANASKIVKEISVTTSDTELGVSKQMTECAVYYNCFNCYRTSLVFQAKSCLYCFWPRMTNFSIGCHYLFDSQFCVKCYNSENLNRCLELSDCNNCTDSMFCYNCESLSDCMFCYNAKNMRHAICNVQVDTETYKKIKALILGQIISELKQTKSFRWSIYDIGSKSG